jgi:GTP-dependent phosphoenolpyruvate carboxykinase
MRQHFDKFGDKLPQGLSDELQALEQRLATANATA